MVSRTPTLYALVWLLGGLLAVPGAGADQSPNDRESTILAILEQSEIRLNDLFRLAELTNPTIAAAQHGVSATAGQARQAGLYPNPTFEFEIEEMSVDDPDNRADKVALGVPLVLSGRLGAASDAGKAARDGAAHELQQTRREIFRQVHASWAEQLTYRDAEAALAELLQIANRTLEIARTRFEARAAPESQVLKAMLEVYDLEVTEQQLAQERVRASATLQALLGGLVVDPERLVGSLATGSWGPATEFDDGTGIAEHPSILAARRHVDSAEASLRAARRERIPDLGIFVAYGRHRTLDEEFVEGGIGIPLPIFDRNQGRVQETEARVQQAVEQARAVENDLAAELAVSRQRYRTARDQLTAFNERIVPAAERSIEQAQEGYAAGRLAFLEMLDAQRTLADVRRRTLELTRDLVVAETDLMSLVGAGPYALEHSTDTDS